MPSSPEASRAFSLHMLVALPRAVEVRGAGKPPMAGLRAAAEGLGAARTHVQSGSPVIETERRAGEVERAPEGRLRAQAGRPLAVILGTGKEMEAILVAHPFPDAEPGEVASCSSPLPRRPSRATSPGGPRTRGGFPALTASRG